MADFHDHTDFWGEYEGSHDGRRARLTVGDARADTAWPVFAITLEDLDRDQTFHGVHHQRTEPSDGEHVLTDVRLPEEGGEGETRYRKLLVHTWDTDHVTGISVWNGRDFGASFQQVNSR